MTTTPPPVHDTASRQPRSALIIGAGLAGLNSLAALRKGDFTGHITVVGAESIPPYDRPPLSKHLLDRTEPTWLSADLGIDVDLADEVILGAGVTALEVLRDDAGRACPPEPSEAPALGGSPRYVATLNDGRRLEADVVIIACGATPKVPSGWDGAHVLHTADDAARLRAALTAERGADRARVPGADGESRATHLVCVGAGWIGAEVSGLAAAAGARVTVLEAGPAPLAQSLGAEVGALVAGWYAGGGVDLRTDALVTSLNHKEVTLGDGETLHADAVLVAIGARPATDWLGGTVAGLVPLLAGGAIDVDAHMRLVSPDGSLVPGLSGVRAVGDCASRRSARHGRVPGGHWDGALRGPAAAAASLLSPGAEASASDPAPYVFSTQFGRELILYGLPSPTDDVVLRGDPGTGPGAPGWAALYFAPGHGHSESQSDGLPCGQPSGALPGGAVAGGVVAGRVLTGILLVDRPRDVAAARKLFAGADLPVLAPEKASDPGTKLTAATMS